MKNEEDSAEKIAGEIADGLDLGDAPVVAEVIATKGGSRKRADLPGPEDYKGWGGSWLSGLNAMAVTLAEISDRVVPCEICAKRHVIPPPGCALELVKREENENLCVGYGRKRGGSFPLDKESDLGINRVMTTKKELKVKAVLEKTTLLAPEGMKVRDVYRETKELWLREDRLMAIPFPFSYETFEGEVRETDSKTFVASEVDITERVKLNPAWKIRRYVDKK